MIDDFKGSLMTVDVEILPQQFFLLIDKQAVACSAEEWAMQFEEMVLNETKHVALQKVKGYRVSTVWLGLNHNYFGGAPHIFETMVFDKKTHDSIYCTRCSTWDEAEKMHQHAIAWIKGGCKEE